MNVPHAAITVLKNPAANPCAAIMVAASAAVTGIQVYVNDPVIQALTVHQAILPPACIKRKTNKLGIKLLILVFMAPPANIRFSSKTYLAIFDKIMFV